MRLKFVPLLLAGLAVVLALGGSDRPAVAVSPAGSMATSTVLDTTLEGVEGHSAEACHTRLRAGAPGVVTETVAVEPGIRFVEASIGAARGDWDFAIFDSTGEAVVASAELDSTESASGWTSTGGLLDFQACRRSGDADEVSVAVFEGAPVGDAAAAKADPPQLVRVATPTRADKNRLVALGLDMTEHGGPKGLGVVLHGAEDRERLRRAGFSFEVLVKDLVAQSVRQRRAENRAVAVARAPGDLPSGRTGTYRTLADYNNEMKALEMANPGLVRTFVMPNQTLLGKEVMGIEIAKDVTAIDGRPAFFNMGVHHAREWPAGEMPMEWAYELVKEYKAGSPRAVNIVENARNIIVPIVNPDGFEASRTAGLLAGASGGRDPAIPDTVYLVTGAATGGEYRRKNCRVLTTNVGNCATSVGLYEPGTDPNRNYAQFWGGPGASSDPTTQTYRGPGPFSEAETQNIRHVVSTNQVTTLITNHTTAALVLRAPGLLSQGDPVDENRGYKALGDAMAKENGYLSLKGFQLYDTTGTTEDWSYNATGGFGFTFEVFCEELDYEALECVDAAFHPTFSIGVEDEWTGNNPIADHTEDPAGAYDGKGNREAYYIAAESTIDETRHSVIEGKAPAGATLRLKKTFQTETTPQPVSGGEDAPILVDDTLDTTYEVGTGGTYEWHINPSTRPIVAKERGEVGAGPPSPPEETTGGLAGSSETADDPDDGAAIPQGATSLSYNDHPFTIPAGGDNIRLDITVEWLTPTSDWDAELFLDVNGNNRSDAGDTSIDVSETGVTNVEQVALDEAGLVPGTKYVLRVSNYAAIEDYTVTKTYIGPEPFQAARTEAWTLTCEVGGEVKQTQEVIIDRGERKTFDLPCGATQATPTPTPTASATPTGTATPTATSTSTPTPQPPPCTVARGLASAKVKPTRNGGALLRFKRRPGVNAPVGVRIYKPATPRKVIKTRAIRQYKAADEKTRFDGTDRSGRKLRNGWYFVRFLVKTDDGLDIRRIVLQRKNGRFKVRKPFDRRATCGTLRVYKLSRPVFGGKTSFPLRASYKLGRAADTDVALLRGGKVVDRVTRNDLPANRRTTVKLGSAKLRRGPYKVRLTITTAGGRTTTTTLTSQKL